MDDNPGRPLPAKPLLVLFAVFFLVPLLCCVGCTAWVTTFPTPPERQAAP
jgi:hypothetical protein